MTRTQTGPGEAQSICNGLGNRNTGPSGNSTAGTQWLSWEGTEKAVVCRSVTAPGEGQAAFGVKEGSALWATKPEGAAKQERCICKFLAHYGLLMSLSPTDGFPQKQACDLFSVFPLLLSMVCAGSGSDSPGQIPFILFLPACTTMMAAPRAASPTSPMVPPGSEIHSQVASGKLPPWPPP